MIQDDSDLHMIHNANYAIANLHRLDRSVQPHKDHGRSVDFRGFTVTRKAGPGTRPGAESSSLSSQSRGDSERPTLQHLVC